MSKYIAIVFLIAIFGMIMTYQNCGPVSKTSSINDPIQTAAAPITITGTVKNLDLENCGKVIISDADKTSTFLVKSDYLKAIPEQSKVEVVGRVAEDAVSTCMVGVILDVDKINVVQ